jgi:hypothetical protein
VSFPNLDELDMVHEILDSAPDAWQKYFPGRVTRLENLHSLIQSFQHQFEKELETTEQIDYLMDQVKKMQGRKEGNGHEHSWSTKANIRTLKPAYKAQANAVDSKKPIGYHPKLSEFPFAKRDDIVTKKGKTPEERGAQPCRNCRSGKHWDNECPYCSQKQSAQVHFVGVDADYLQALEDHENAQISLGGEEKNSE